MSYQEVYRQKLTTADEAVKVVKSGDWVDFGWCTDTPDALDKALARRAGELTDVKIRGGVLLRRPAIADVPDAASHFSWNSAHMSGVERKMISEGLAYYLPIRYSELPSYYLSGNARVDVVMIQVAPMDEHGWFNFGPSISHLKAACEMAKTVVVEVNRNMPVCFGGFDNGIHIDDVDMVVEGDNPAILTMGGGETVTDPVDLAIAKLVVEEIPNGACLQLGIGSVPNAIGKMIAESDLKNLGIHTEMYVDAFVDIAKAGKITGARKSIDKGRQVYTFAAGTQKLYDYIDGNPACMAAPVNYVNDVRTISSLDNFVSINNAVEVDLFGQVASESSGIRHISGAGGALDFVLGAYLSKGGKSFICCSSTVKNKDGSVKSRLTPYITPGGIITATRANIHYLVTEYGMVNLKGTSTWQRAEKIISVAHPDFRDELIAEAEKMHIWKQSNKR